MSGFYYIDDASKQQCGPFSPDELKSKNLRPETMVWKSGMGDWVEARTVAEISFLFNLDAPTQTANPQASQYSQAANTTNYNQTSYNQTQYNQPQNGYNPNANGGYRGYQNNQGGINDVRPMPKNWLVESILVTVLCCLPFGIAGIMSATKVESLYYSGDYEAAEQASKDAKKWTIVGFSSTFVLGLLYIIFVVLLGFASSF